MTAGENIGLGDVSRMDDARGIAEAGRLAQADRFIEELPKGYDNPLGSEFFGGANLSLGQWQRIALARAFFRNAPFVILDEPTASLDPRAEAALFENVRSLYKNRAVLLISHRFSSVRSADRIYVMDSGLVVESGTHEQLMAMGGQYAELFELQASAYHPDRPAS
jgi:ATP-binding cassette subfamily B protein